MNSAIKKIFMVFIFLLLIFAVFLCMTGCTVNKGSISYHAPYSSPDLQHPSDNSSSPAVISEVLQSDEPLPSSSASACGNSAGYESSAAQGQGSPKSESRSIPVLMYHSVAYEKNNPVRIPQEKFKEQMKYLKDNGYSTLSLDDLYSYFEEGVSVPAKSVVLTFDDGYEDNYKNAYPILKEYGFKASIFMITGSIDKKSYLTSSELKELDENGISIESHTVTHCKLQELSYDEQLKEFKNSKETLEKLLNKKVIYAAYPYGSYNKDTIKAAKDAGYTMAFTTDGRWSGKEDGLLTLDRVYISGFFNLDTFKERITNPNYKIQ